MPKYNLDRACAVGDKRANIDTIRKNNSKIASRSKWISILVVMGVIVSVYLSTFLTIRNISFSFEIGDIGSTEVKMGEFSKKGFIDDIDDMMETFQEWIDLLLNSTSHLFEDVNMTKVFEDALNSTDIIQDIMDALGISDISELNITAFFEAIYNGTLAEILIKGFLNDVIDAFINVAIPDDLYTPLVIIVNNGGIYTTKIRFRVIAGFNGNLDYTLIDGNIVARPYGSDSMNISVGDIIIAFIDMAATILIDAIYDAIMTEGEITETFFTDWLEENFENLKPVGRADIGFNYGFIGIQGTLNLDLFELLNSTIEGGI